MKPVRSGRAASLLTAGGAHGTARPTHSQGNPIVRTLLSSGFGVCLAFATLTASAFQSPVRLSVYQGPCREGDFPANLALTRTIVAQALERDSHFLALPECFLSGYESPDAVRRGARPLDDSDLRAFIGESARHDLVILAGLARRAGTNLFNTVLVIHRGRLLGFYDKVMLTGGDRDVLGFRPGSSVPIFQAHGLRFGVIVCADSSYPHVALAARLQGAQILFSPHYNEIGTALVDDHRRWVRNCHVGLACQLKVVVARPNVVRTERPGQVGYGDSFILSPQGEPLAEAKLFATELVTATITPAMFQSPFVWADLAETPGWLRSQLADLLGNFRPPRDDADLGRWLTNMVTYHRYTPAEVASATGLPLHEVAAALRRFGLVGPTALSPRAMGEPIRIQPFPGGRHPRLGFYDGAVAPQRETKVSVFPPWEGGGYVVVDVPEAIFSNLGLTYLAHTHIPTLWDRQGIRLPPTEWTRHPDGRLSHERILPNGVAFGADVVPGVDGVRFGLWLRNGTSEPLTGLRVQNCAMLGWATGFGAQTLSNKVFKAPFASASSPDGRRWIITQWERCGRAWGNEQVPCLHSDPVFPDCSPGETVRLRGWLSFYEGTDLDSELASISTRSGIPAPP